MKCFGQCFDPLCSKEPIRYNDSGIAEIQMPVMPLFLSKALQIDEIVDSFKLNKPYSGLVFTYDGAEFYAPIDYSCEKSSTPLLDDCIEKKKELLITIRVYKFVHPYYCPDRPFAIIVQIAEIEENE